MTPQRLRSGRSTKSGDSTETTSIPVAAVVSKVSKEVEPEKVEDALVETQDAPNAARVSDAVCRDRIDPFRSLLGPF